MDHRYLKAIRLLIVNVILLFTAANLWASSPQVKETILPNGLKIITKEVHAAPVVAFQIWYKVGSRNEAVGKTGISHLLEHMMFKGTKQFGKGEIDRIMQQNGAINNAGTSKDYTYYYETMASDKLELAIKIESDRMVNSLLDAREFNAEKTVVLSELEGHENMPDSLIFYELYATAFKSHPYRWPTIGWRTDVESISRTDLYNYYKTYYMPNNATVVIVGDFDTETAINLVRKYFGPIPKGPIPPKVTAIEPLQSGERRAVIRKAGSAPRIMIGYHIPRIGRRDTYALDVIELVLSGGMSGRLYRNLVDKQIAASASAGAAYGKDPNLFILSGTARDGVKIDDVESALLMEIERLKTEPISPEELQKALNQLEAQFVYTNDSVTDQAELLGYFDTLYTWHFIDKYLENVRRVTTADVQRVAQKYFILKNSTTAVFLPEGTQTLPQPNIESDGDRITTISTRNLIHSLAAYKSNASLPFVNTQSQSPTKTPMVDHIGTSVSGQLKKDSANKKNDLVKPLRITLDNGMVVIVQENKSNPTVAISGSINAGGVYDPINKNGLAGITAEMLKKGTSTRTAEQINAEEDFSAISTYFTGNMECAVFGGYSLAKHFDKMLDMMADMIRNPSFPEDELNKTKALRLSAIKQELDNPEAMAFRSFYNAAFPPNSPYYRPSVEEDIANISAIQRTDVLNFYKDHYGPDATIIAITGDIDASQAIELVKKYFGSWQKIGATTKAEIPDPPELKSTVKRILYMPDKSQVEILFGYPGRLKRTDKDFYAANVMNFILGGGGALGSRLGDEIRDRMGLAYNVYSFFDATRGAGPWIAYMGTNPDNVNKAIKLLIDQIETMRKHGAKKSEITNAIDFLTGSFPVRLETNSQIAATLRSAEYYDLGMDYIQNYRKIYRSITLDQVNQAARKYLRTDKYVLIISGPYQEK